MFHSATKYLGGHSDTVLGVAVTRDDEVAERLRFLQNAMGGVPGPFDCFLVLRGLRTLTCGWPATRRTASRSRGSSRRATTSRRSSYPGLDSADPTRTPGRRGQPPDALASSRRSAAWSRSCPRRAARHGRSAAERAIAVCESTRLFTLAESLGGVESLIEIPAAMTHMSVAESPLAVDPALDPALGRDRGRRPT